MFTRYRTKGFIFGKRDFRESDRIFSIFTQDFGSLEVLAKGERKITSKLRTALELFYLSEIEFIQGKTHKTLTDASGKEKFRNIRTNFKKLKVTFRILGILEKFLKFTQPDGRIWNLIIIIFKELNNCETPGNTLCYYYFLWNFLSILGYQPELNSCVLCQEKLKEGEFNFSFKEGGIVCQNCFRKMDLKEKECISKINLEVLKILKIFLTENISILKKIKITQEERKSLKIFSNNFLSFFPNQ